MNSFLFRKNLLLLMHLSQFMIINSKKKSTELLSDFKIYLSEIILILSNNYTDSHDDLITKCKVFIDSLYNLLMKIKFYLVLLEIKDQNQTNKYEYEKCLNSTSFINFNNISHIIQKLHEFTNNDLEIHNKKLLDITKMEKPILIDEYKENFNQLIINTHYQMIMQYNNFINHILLEVLCVFEIIKNVSITSNNW